MATILMSSFSRGLTPSASSTPPVADKNWNPGNYIAETSYDTTALFNQIATRLQNDTAGHYKGVLLRYPWPTLEPTEGVYTGFDTIEARLEQIAALSGRRAIIFIQLKTFNSVDASGNVTSWAHAVPAYMRSSATYADPDGNTNGLGEYGEYTYLSGNGGPGGQVPNMHVTAVKNKFIAMMQAFGTRFNSNPNLEAVVINEASISKPYQVTTTWSRNPTWFTNMTSSWGSTRTALSNIQCCQWINSDRNDMQNEFDVGFVPDITALGVGLGMPDGAKDDKGFNINPTNSPNTGRGNIYLCQQHNGDAIIMVHASKPALEGTVITESQTVANASPGQYAYHGQNWTRQQMSTWYKDTVGATHVCWAHNTGTHSLNTTYSGQNYNTVTDAHIANGSDISTVTTRPTGW